MLSDFPVGVRKGMYSTSMNSLNGSGNGEGNFVKTSFMDSSRPVATPLVVRGLFVSCVPVFAFHSFFVQGLDGCSEWGRETTHSRKFCVIHVVVLF